MMLHKNDYLKKKKKEYVKEYLIFLWEKPLSL